MAHEQLQKYIEESLKAGHSENDIKEALKTAGWKEEDLKDILAKKETSAGEAKPQAKMSLGKNRNLIIASIAAVAVLALGAAGFAWFSGKMTTQMSGTTTPGNSTSTATTTPTVPQAPAVAAANCTDSDAEQGADAIYTAGTVNALDSSGNTSSNTDECATEDPQYLFEWVCMESPVGSGKFGAGRTIVKCPKGCKAGACAR